MCKCTVHNCRYSEFRIPYPVPVCVTVTGNLWLVKFDGFMLQPMAKTNHNFPMHGKQNRIRNSKFTVLFGKFVLCREVFSSIVENVLAV